MPQRVPVAYEPGGDWTAKLRWVPVRNDASEVIPPYALLRVTGMVLDEGFPVFTVAKPNADDLTNVLVGGPVPIPAGERGAAHATFPGEVRYEPADGTPAAGSEWGTASGAWGLRSGKAGFVVVGVSAPGVAVVRVAPPAAGGGGTITVEDDDGSPSYSGIDTLRFDQGDGFVLSNPAAGVAQVDFVPPAAMVYHGVCDLRISASATPAGGADEAASTTLSVSLFKGNKIGLKVGSAWGIYFATSNTISVTGLAADTLYDVFAYASGFNAAYEVLAWSSAGAGTSTRATGLAYDTGVLVKASDATRRYLGTFLTHDSGGGAVRVADTITRRHVWNYYHRTLREAYAEDGTDLTYTTASWQDYNADDAARVTFVVGHYEDILTFAALATLYDGGSVGVSLNGATPVEVVRHDGADPLSAGVTESAIPPTGLNYAQAQQLGSGTTGEFERGAVRLWLWC